MHGCKNVNTNIDPFIPKCEIRQRIEFVSDFLFCYLSADSNKQHKLVNNN